MATNDLLLNKANRQVADVLIKVLNTQKPFLLFDTANVTTAGLTGDSVYAMAKGSRRIAFPNPMTGTLTIEAQVYPFKMFSMLSNGQILSDAVYDKAFTVEGEAGGVLNIEKPTNAEIVTDLTFVYPAGSVGDEDAVVEGSWEAGKFTATTPDEITEKEKYVVWATISATKDVHRISFRNDNIPPDYYITMHTLDKSDIGTMAEFLMTAYKASIQRTWELSFTSEGDPATVTLTFDLMEDKDGNILDMIELGDDSGE